MDLLTDARLTLRDRVVGLLLQRVASEDEPVEISFESIAKSLPGFPTRNTISASIRVLVGLNYFERFPGGRGHSDKFRATPEHTLLDRVFPDGALSVYSVPPADTLSVRSSRRDVVDEVDVEPRVVEALSSEKLKGCRGALRDYLKDRVPAPRRYAYVQTLITWIDGGADASVFRLRDGGQYQKSRTRLMAEALNDLGGSDEGQMKRPTGDPANLRTKINILIRSGEHGRPEEGNHGTGRPEQGRRNSTRAGARRADPAKWKSE